LANTVNELIELAKKEPGKIDFGAPGPGSPIHLAKMACPLLAVRPDRPIDVTQ
jgi:tripartite-type tricarboxylate transporter receptor subunit TctC